MKHNIENYENMTIEEKLAALEAYEPDMSGFVTKAQLDKVASEAASYKKQLREKMTEEEVKAAKDAEERNALLTRVAELEREHTVINYTSSFLSMGYDEALAKETADVRRHSDHHSALWRERSQYGNGKSELAQDPHHQLHDPAL